MLKRVQHNGFFQISKKVEIRANILRRKIDTQTFDNLAQMSNFIIQESKYRDFIYGRKSYVRTERKPDFASVFAKRLLSVEQFIVFASP